MASALHFGGCYRGVLRNVLPSVQCARVAAQRLPRAPLASASSRGSRWRLKKRAPSAMGAHLIAMAASPGWNDRTRAILGPHSYVSFALDEQGHAVHLSRTANCGVVVAEVPVGAMPTGARYANVEDRTFATGATSGDAVDKDGLLTTLESFLDYRGRRPLIVQVSPQGWHENVSSKLVLGVVDTGGQNKYINESGLAMTALGFTVVNATRGGPRHLMSGESRCGMHYSHTHMDLLFLEDHAPAEFIVKERMFAAPGWGSGARAPPHDGIFHPLARALQRHLWHEPKQDTCTLVGHYADGGAVACLARQLMGRHGIAVWFNPQSLGAEKAVWLAAAGATAAQLEQLRIAARLEYERYALASADGVLCTSQQLAKALLRDYGGRGADHVMVPGVDTKQFCPRPTGRCDSVYAPLWSELAALSGRTPAVLQEATIILEISRTVRSKGKATVLRAFAELLTAEHRAADSLFLAMNIADPTQAQLGPEEAEVGAELQALVDALGVRPWLLSKNHFTQAEVPQLHQVLSVFITGAISEPWGMTVQQAAACGQMVVASTAVPSAIEALAIAGPQRLEAVPGQRVLVSAGALFFEPNDHRAAAAALQWALDHRHEAAKMAARAHKMVMQRYAWQKLVWNWLMRVGYRFEAGQVTRGRSTPKERELITSCDVWKTMAMDQRGPDAHPKLSA